MVQKQSPASGMPDLGSDSWPRAPFAWHLEMGGRVEPSLEEVLGSLAQLCRQDILEPERGERP